MTSNPSRKRNHNMVNNQQSKNKFLRHSLCSIVLGLALMQTNQVFAEETQSSQNSTVAAESSSLIVTNGPEDVTSQPSATSVEVTDNLATETTTEELEVVSQSEITTRASSDTNAPALLPATPLNVVEQFGAKGDGVTDDRQAIQDAIDAASQGQGGGHVYFPEGTYFVEEIVFLKSNVTLNLHEQATILNGINQKNHPSIVFMTGLFTDDGDQVEWEPTENITVIGGTIDMNGALNEEGTKAKNLPLINSAGAFAIGNSTNFTIKNVTFKDSYKGHAIQIAGSTNVLIDGSKFLGQALPSTLKDNQIISYESIQIEPLLRKGFPYALNNTGKRSEHITIQNSYFGKSDKTGELVTAIGTHYQDITTENPRHIHILNNHFDNMMYAGVRFTGFSDVLIQGNHFTKKAKEDSVHYRENGAALVNAYSYNNKKDVLDLNKRVTITENTFDIADPKTRAIRAAKDNVEYLGKVTDITVTNNEINNTSVGSELPAIQMLRVSDNITITDNKLTGGHRGIVIEESTGSITLNNNQMTSLANDLVQLNSVGYKGAITVSSLGQGALAVRTENGHYIINEQAMPGHAYSATYADKDQATFVDRSGKLTLSLNQTEPSTQVLHFKPSSTLTLSGNLDKMFDGKEVALDHVTVTRAGSQGHLTYKFYADKEGQVEISSPKMAGTYYLRAFIEEDENFAGAASDLLLFTIMTPKPAQSNQPPKTEQPPTSRQGVTENQTSNQTGDSKTEVSVGKKSESESRVVPVKPQYSVAKSYDTGKATLPKTNATDSTILSLLSGIGSLLASVGLFATRKKHDGN